MFIVFEKVTDIPGAGRHTVNLSLTSKNEKYRNWNVCTASTKWALSRHNEVFVIQKECELNHFINQYVNTFELCAVCHQDKD